MSDIEKRIEQWRGELARSESVNGSEISELENHLREEMDHLRTSGLSEEEAFLVARRRLGDPAAIEGEFAKVSPHRPLANRLSWMAIGVLGYFLLLYLSTGVSHIATLLGRNLHLPHSHIAVLASVTQLITFAGVGLLVLRRCGLWQRNPTASKAMPSPLRASGFAACGVLAMYWVERICYIPMARTMSIRELGELTLVQHYLSLAGNMLMPILAVAAIAILARRNQKQTATR